jgi:two-component system response regulator FlrC
VAVDPASTKVLELARRVAASDATVLVCGESGTGKEVVARYVHRHSARSGGPFVAIY